MRSSKAASTVAGDQEEFFRWLEGTNIEERKDQVPTDAFQVVRDQAKCLPIWLPTVGTPYFDTGGLHDEFLTELGNALGTQPTADTTFNETLRESLPTIQTVWEDLQLLNKEMENYGPREADWRFPLDTLIQHVLRREKDTLVYREVTIRLVHSNTKAMETATADLVVVLRRPPITRLSRKDHIECASLPYADLSALHVIHFVSESRELFTTASGQNQLIYGLSTGLLQKRLIGLEDQFVFGCCIVGRTIESYVASWDKGKPIVYFLDKFHPLTVPGLLQFFLFLCLVKSQIPSYYEKLSNINAEEVELALTNFGPWRARKAHPVPQIADDEGDDDADGALGPGNAPGTSGHGGPSGHRRGNLRDRAGRRGRGRKGPSKMPPPSDRRLRSHDVLQPGRMGGHIIDEDFVWVGTVSKWRDDAARAISHYGPPASLTESSVAELPQALNPHLIVGPGGKDDFEEISE